MLFRSVWDLRGRELAVLEGHQASVLNASFSPDGQRIVTASDDNTARVWPVESLDALLVRACNYMDSYLRHDADATDKQRALCNIPPKETEG